VGVRQPSFMVASSFAEVEVAVLRLPQEWVTATTVCRYPHATATTDTETVEDVVARALRWSLLPVLWRGLWSPPLPFGLLFVLLALLLLSPPRENTLAGKTIGEGWIFKLRKHTEQSRRGGLFEVTVQKNNTVARKKKMALDQRRLEK